MRCRSRGGRGDILCALAVVLALPAFGCGDRATPAASRPNVLVVCIDALRADRLGVYGASPSPSPSLDALARDSMVFTNASSVASWTKPAVPSLLTGVYPDERGVFDNSGSEVDTLPPDQPTLAQLFADQGWRTAAFVENDQLLRRLSGLDRGFSLYADEAGSPPEIADRFLNWSALEPGKPWFAYLHFFDPHFPYSPDAFLFREDEQARLRSRLAHWDLLGEFWWMLRERVNRAATTLDASGAADLDRLYRLEISEVDAVVGRMLGALERAATLERTLVVVTADHGEGFLERGRIDHGYGPYRELLHVPLLVRLPGHSHSGLRSDALVQNMDLAATALEVAAIPAPAPWSSRSLLSVVEHRQAARSVVLSQEHHGRSTQVSVRDARFHYVRSETAPAPPPPRVVLPPSLVEGTRVRAHGIFDGKRLVAGSVRKIAAGDPDIEVEGPVDEANATSRAVRVLGVEIAVGAGVDDGSDHLVQLERLVPGIHVRAHGSVEAGAFRPTKIELVDRGPIEVEGVVHRAALLESGDAEIDLGGVAIVVDPKVRWSDFADKPERAAQVRAPGAAQVVEELFDRSADPAELHDIASTSPQEIERFRRLDAEARASRKAAPGAGRADLDDDARERLRALGYVE